MQLSGRRLSLRVRSRWTPIPRWRPLFEFELLLPYRFVWRPRGAPSTIYLSRADPEWPRSSGDDVGARQGLATTDPSVSIGQYLARTRSTNTRHLPLMGNERTSHR